MQTLKKSKLNFADAEAATRLEHARFQLRLNIGTTA